MDFEEELGSPNLPAAVAANRDRFAADMLIVFDGPRHATNRLTLHFGARGIATLSLEVFGPRVPQHSGHFGNYAPNPAWRLAELDVRLVPEVSYDAFRTPDDAEVGEWLTRALEPAFGEEPMRIRMVGGSIPIAPFVATLGIPAVGVPAVQLDNNQHSPNENLRLGNYIDGVPTYLAALTEPFGEQ